MKLSERAMLASLHISRWAGTRTDKKVSADVAAQHAVAERRAGHYRKHAINVDAPSYKAVITASGDLRTRHTFYTLPWAEDGARILPAANFEKYSEEMRKLTAAFDATVATFVADFPALKAQAKVELNGLYNEEDYPADVASHFGVKVKILGLPDADDFRVKLPDSAVAAIRADISAELQKTTSVAMREPYERLHAHIKRMVERLTDKDTDGKANTFRNTLITGLAELCAVLPALNLTNDPNLEQLRQRCEGMIAGIDPQTLRDSPTVRAHVAKQAQEIQDAMAAFMGPQS